MTPGCYLRIWGIKVQTSYVEGQWHQNGGYKSPQLFLQTDKEISEQRKYLTLRPDTWKRIEILGWVIKVKMIAIHRGPNAFLEKIGLEDSPGTI